MAQRSGLMWVVWILALLLLAGLYWHALDTVEDLDEVEGIVKSTEAKIDAVAAKVGVPPDGAGEPTPGPIIILRPKDGGGSAEWETGNPLVSAKPGGDYELNAGLFNEAKPFRLDDESAAATTYPIQQVVLNFKESATVSYTLSVKKVGSATTWDMFKNGQLVTWDLCDTDQSDATYPDCSEGYRTLPAKLFLPFKTPPQVVKVGGGAVPLPAAYKIRGDFRTGS